MGSFAFGIVLRLGFLSEGTGKKGQRGEFMIGGKSAGTWGPGQWCLGVCFFVEDIGSWLSGFWFWTSI